MLRKSYSFNNEYKERKRDEKKHMYFADDMNRKKIDGQNLTIDASNVMDAEKHEGEVKKDGSQTNFYIWNKGSANLPDYFNFAHSTAKPLTHFSSWQFVPGTPDYDQVFAEFIAYMIADPTREVIFKVGISEDERQKVSYSVGLDNVGVWEGKTLYRRRVAFLRREMLTSMPLSAMRRVHFESYHKNYMEPKTLFREFE
jgi:hypothetical protein